MLLKNHIKPIKSEFDFTNRLYDPDKSKDDNFAEKRNYFLLRMDKNNLRLEDPRRLFDQKTKYLTKVDDIFEYGNSLETVFVDTFENSLHAVYLKKFKKYNTAFFDCEERVFFEALLIKHRAFTGEFTWSIQQCEKELGIKRFRRKSIIKKFIDLGILETNVIPLPLDEMKGITQFSVNVQRVIDLLPEIYDSKQTDLEEMRFYIQECYLD